MRFRTIDQKPNGDEFAKARELIEIRGTGGLSLQDRRVMNVLYANAGTSLCDDIDHMIAIAELRGSHKGGERVTDSIRRLMRTLVEVPTKDSEGAPATKLVQILSDSTVTDNENNPLGQVKYSFSRGMRDIIKDSTLWGRVRNAVVFSFTSKYALALYELITARINLKHKWQEEFSVKDLRALLGVPDKKLERIPNLLQRVIQPACLEVNGLADFGVTIEPIRKGGKVRGLVTGFRVSWWRKETAGLQAAYSELKQPKVGRRARLEGRVETMEPIPARLPSPTRQEKIDATVRAMRQAGAPESDIEIFLNGQQAGQAGA
jgi:Initiator Replication protein